MTIRMTCGQRASDVVDVVVIGDGPAGSALAKGCARRGLSTVLVGPDADWAATYGCWVDDLDGLPGSIAGDPAATTIEPGLVRARGADDRRRRRSRRHRLDRPYGVLDNGALRADLRARGGAPDRACRTGRARGRVTTVSSSPAATRSAGPPGRRCGRVAVEVRPRRRPAPARAAQPAWQTAVGVVLRDAAATEISGSPTLMDFRPVAAGGRDDRASTIGPAGVTSFAYALPVADGWLVEETVLAARPAVEPVALLARLAARLGRHPDELLADAVRTRVRPDPDGRTRCPRPISPWSRSVQPPGTSIRRPGTRSGASLRAVPRVVDGIVAAVDTRRASIDSSIVWDAGVADRAAPDPGVPRLRPRDADAARRRRHSDVLRARSSTCRSSAGRATCGSTRSPAETARGDDGELFRASSWSLRRQLAVRNPVALARLIRP